MTSIANGEARSSIRAKLNTLFLDTTAEAGSTHVPGGVQWLRIGTSVYHRDASGTDLTTGDGATWALAQTAITEGGTGAATAAAARTNLSVPEVLTENLTVTIPTDYATLQAAYDALKNVVPAGHIITLRIEAGHSPASGLAVADTDARHFWISSDDSIVTLPESFTDTYFVQIVRAEGPVLNCLVDAGNVTVSGWVGYSVAVGPSSGSIEDFCGVINSPGKGFECRGSIVSGNSSVWNGAADTGVRIQQGSIVRFNDATANNCGSRGFYVSRGCMAQLMETSATGCGPASEGSIQEGAFVIRRSYANLSGADGSGSLYGIYATRAAVITANEGDFSECVVDSIRATDGCLVNAAGADLVNSNRQVRAQFGSTVNIRGSIVESTTETATLEVLGGATIATTNLKQYTDGAKTVEAEFRLGLDNLNNVRALNSPSANGTIYGDQPSEILRVNDFEAEGWAQWDFARNRVFTVADDDVATIDFPFGSGGGRSITAIVHGNGAQECALLYIRGNNEYIFEMMAGPAIETSTSVLNGTTGTDGVITVGVNGNTIYLENRLGSERDIAFNILSSNYNP